METVSLFFPLLPTSCIFCPAILFLDLLFLCSEDPATLRKSGYPPS